MDECGESSSSHQVPDGVYAPETPAKPDQLESNIFCKNWLENPFVEAILEDTSVTKSFSCYEDSIGSTRRIYDTGSGMYNGFSKEHSWKNMSCMNLLSIANGAVGNGVGNSGGGGAFLADLNFPPQAVTEPWLNIGLSLQFTTLTPDQAKSAGDVNKQVESNEDGTMNLNLNLNLYEQSQADVSALAEGNQDLEKGIYEQTHLNKTPQPKEKRRKHRPKVVTEGKPKRQRKPATPKKPETPNPDGTSTGKRKYVRKKVAEKPGVEEQTKKSCKRKIDFNEPELEPDVVVEKRRVKTEVVVEKTQVETEVVVEKTQVEHVVDLTCSSSEVENCQKYLHSESPSPITPSKSEIPQGRSKNDYTVAKCKINFLQETHDKGPSSVPSPNQSTYSTSSSINKREEPHGFGSLESFLSTFTDYSGGGKQSIQLPALYKKKPEMQKETGVKNKQKPEMQKETGVKSSVPSPNQSTCSTSSSINKREEPHGFESLESFLSTFTDYSGGGKQSIQLPALYKKKPEMQKETGVKNKQQSNRNKASGYLKITKKKKSEPFRLMNGSASHQQNFQLSIANKNQRNSKPMMPSFYPGHQFTNYIGFHPNMIYGIGIDALIYQFERLNISGRMREEDRGTMVPYMYGYHENNALVAYQQGRSMVPYEGLFNQIKRRKTRAKVDLDNETERVWRLLLEDINSQGIDGTDEEKAKWWEEERRVFRGRADSFIARMHLVQGDRRFSKWKGSVLDSVVGVFLTQNVSDHLSSSAFMALAAKYPPKSNSSSKPINEEEPVLSDKEACHIDEEVGPMMLQEADSFDKKEVNSNDFSKSSVSIVDLNDNSVCKVQELPEKDELENDEIVSSQNSAVTSPSSVQSSVAKNTERLNPCSMHSSEEKQKVGKDSVLGGYTSFVELLHMQGASAVHERTIIQSNSEKSVSEESGISVESTSQTIVKAISSQGSANNNHEVHKVTDLTNISTDTSIASESSKIVEASGVTGKKVVDFNVIDKVRIQKSGKKQTNVDWDNLRLQAEVEQKRETTQDTMDSLDYEALRNASVSEVADAIKERGMNNVLAVRIKAMLERLVQDHGSTDLEWLRDVPPDKAKEYLLSFRGLGLKSVECIRLLTLHHLAFPVDTNVGRIAVRLGWVPLQSLPESLQLHLLELYPIQESIQKYLWPRLCKLDQRTLYELHYQMITFGKVFCTKTKPNCNACPLRGECRHFASAFASARLGLPAPEESKSTSTENKTSQGQLTLPPASEELQPLSEVEKCISVIEKPTTSHRPIVEMPASPEPLVEMPASPEPIVEVPATPEPEQIQHKEFDLEDFGEDSEEIPTIKLNIEEFHQNLQTYMERHMELGEGGMSKALVAITSEAASIPTPKLKNVSQLRTEHHVYELPDSHPLLQGLETREPDDPCSYLLAIWTPGETADSMQPPEGQCSSQESGILCNEETCFFCSSTREANAQTVRGTLLIPCRTAMRGSFPLNGTYFQVNEVFADHESSLNPIDVPRSWLWNLPRRMVYFGTSIPTIFKGLTTEDIQYCFWRGFVCVRGFDQKTRAPRPLMARLHFPASKLKKPNANAKTEENEKPTR